jgi:N-acetylmuramoyl-L-alanine amidase
MKIENHRLYEDDGQPVRFEQTPNISSYALEHQYLVIHYTAGKTVQSAVNTLTNPRVSASAHLVIGRDGSVVQLAEFDKVTWHAGLSSWQGLNGLNRYSIGIELDNSGKLEKSQDGAWHAWYGDVIEDSQVLEAPHKNYPSVLYGWQLYTPEQLLISLEISELLVHEYNLKDIVGHDDIAPRRKTDPGPAFPMDSFRSRILGRADVEESQTIYRTKANLNIRTGPSTNYQKIDISPLPKGVRLEIIDIEGVWKMVNVLDEVKGEVDISGWVHGNYIEPI